MLVSLLSIFYEGHLDRLEFDIITKDHILEVQTFATVVNNAGYTKNRLALFFVCSIRSSDSLALSVQRP